MNALRAFVDRVAPHVDRVAIAVGAPGIEDTTERLRQLSDLVARCEAATRDAATTVDVIPVDPWGAFTPALNALAAHASKQGCGLALFASVETTFSSETVAALREQLLKHDALVVGAALPGHDFQEGRRPLGGRTAPWNTLALWRSAWEPNFGRRHRRDLLDGVEFPRHRRDVVQQSLLDGVEDHEDNHTGGGWTGSASWAFRSSRTACTRASPRASRRSRR